MIGVLCRIGVPGICHNKLSSHQILKICNLPKNVETFKTGILKFHFLFRPSGNSNRNDLAQYNPSNDAGPQLPATRSGASTSNHHNAISPQQISPGSPHVATSSSMASSGRIQSPAVATPAPRISKEVAFRPSDQQQRNISTHPPQLATPITKTSGHPNVNHHNLSQSHDDISINVSVSSYMTSESSAINTTTTTTMIPERDTGPIKSIKMTPPNCKPIPHRPMSGPAKLTIQSIPVKSQPPMLSSGLGNLNKTPTTIKTIQSPPTSIATPPNTMQHQESHHSAASSKSSPTTSQHQSKPITSPGNAPPHQMPFHGSNHPQKATTVGMRTHHHGGTHEFRGLHRVNECHSSSDENRSSGHASMSDTGHGSSSPGGNRSNEHLGPLPEDRLAAGVTNRSARSRASTGHSRPRHRGGAPTKVPWGGGGLEDIKLAIQQLTMRSQTSTSTYSSLSAGSESSEPARRLGRYSSLETVNTNVTSADEFVWVDSHNRLVELQHPPWSQHCVLRVIRGGRCRENSERISAEAVPRLGYLLQRALVRVAREIQRLSVGLGLCSKHEVAGAFKIVLCPALADSCIKACLRAAAMFAVPGDSALRQSKSSRAGLQLPIGRFHRWMADARLGKFVHEYAAVYLSAGLENLLEEILLQCLPSDVSLPLTATGLEHAIAGSGDLWGLLQPYAHLNAGRIASGALTMPRWASQSSIGSAPHSQQVNPAMEPCLLTTCVGSIGELKDLVLRAQNKFHHTALSHASLIALFYFMRCSQLEHSEGSSGLTGGNSSVQELCYERAYVVLPPLVEWLRVATAHAEYRHSILIDKDDIMQSARLLLPGVDCPPRPVSTEEELPSKKTKLPGQCVISSQQHHPQSPIAPGLTTGSDDINEYGRRATLALSFRLMMSGRPELLMQAATLLPPTTRYDTLNPLGMTALMVAVIRNDEQAIQMLLDVGADPNIEVPTVGTIGCPAIHPETQQWTAITFAACRGNYQAVRLLLERGGHVEGGARLSEDKCTLTPLQVSSGSGCLDVVSLLLAHGAHAFLSTQQKDSMCFAGSAQRGCYSAISVAAAHGQRTSLRKLLSHPLAPGSREVLSLEEMLAEGDSSTRTGAIDRQNEAPPTLNKTQIKCLQEAMYHSAENNHLGEIIFSCILVH